jgi:DNA-directed RNA polymerase specialized sigma24 family protein
MARVSSDARNNEAREGGFTPMEEPSFAELIRRSRRGDPEAARWLVERYESAVRREVRFSLKDNSLRRVLDEADVCQSVMAQFFVGLWAGRFEVSGPEQLIALLKTMVRNKVVDRARYWNAGRRDFGRNVAALDPGNPIELASAEPTPSVVVSNAELLAEFQRRLSEQERAILSLRQQGLDWSAVSERLGGENAEVLRKRLAKGLDRVGRELGLER